MSIAEALPIGLLVLAIFIGISLLATRIRALEHKLSVLMTHLQIDPAAHVSRRVKDLAADPTQRSAAIKAFREETGLGLKDCADAVNELRRRSRRAR